MSSLGSLLERSEQRKMKKKGEKAKVKMIEGKTKVKGSIELSMLRDWREKEVKSTKESRWKEKETWRLI